MIRPTRATRSIAHAGGRHEVFNETNSDEVLADVNAFIDSVLEGSQS